MPDRDPIQRLREVVEAATPGEWFHRNAGVRVKLSSGEIKIADCPTALPAPLRFPEHKGGFSDAALIVASTRLARALVESSLTERLVHEMHRGVCSVCGQRAEGAGGGVLMCECAHGSWREPTEGEQAQAVISLLAAQALGGGDG